MCLVLRQKQPSAAVLLASLGCEVRVERSVRQPLRGAAALRTAGWGVARGRGCRVRKASRPRAAERGASRCWQRVQRPASSVWSGRPARERKVLGHHPLLWVLVFLWGRSWGRRWQGPRSLLVFPLQGLLVGIACRPSGRPGQCQFPLSIRVQADQRGLRAWCAASQAQASLTCLGH
ncbi:hypothetical protein NN561_019731 [Cricetulus griseus]